ncbi:MAG: biopolymer transporter ExbD [Verrucomicrobiae bacterium]|nr:biopolymer transporter ExbD [Verrucomicrobiae bacterium]
MKFYEKRRRHPTIIVVTMIDIFCVLLIFFIVATTFRRSNPAIKIALPEATTGQPVSTAEPVLLTVSADEKIYLDAKEVPLVQLRETLRQIGGRTPQPALAMQADRKASFGFIVKVMDAAKEAGFTSLPAFIEQGNTAPP